MKSHAILLGAAAVLISGGLVSAQMQYDSLGSPTPRPNQEASPNKIEPNIPRPSGTVSVDAGKPATSATGSTTSSSTSSTTGSGTLQNDATNDQTAVDTGVTPGGLAPD